MRISETSWSLGILVWVPIAVLLVVLFVGLAAVVWTKIHPKSHDKVETGGLALGLLALGVGFMVGTLIGMYPYSAEHHQYRPASGTVANISDRIVSAEGSISQRFVVTFEGDSQQYGCDDTRCATIKPGDGLSLSCIRSWEYAATDGYNCRFIDWDDR